MQATFGSSVTGAVLRVFWTAILMGGLGVAAYFCSTRWSLNSMTPGTPWRSLLGLFPFAGATALGGALAVRVLGSRWPEPALAALLLIVVSLSVTSGVAGWTAFSFACATPLYAGGVFLLPLFDPAVRRHGLAPTRWKVAVATLAIISVLLITGLAVSDGSVHSRMFLIWVGGGGLLGSIALWGLAVVMTAVRLLTWGAYCGALGWVLFVGTYLVAFGAAWLFP